MTLFESFIATLQMIGIVALCFSTFAIPINTMIFINNADWDNKWCVIVGIVGAVLTITSWALCVWIFTNF